ncbi:coil containing protein [Vibrio phage 2.117.O._10N.261.45.E9]|nr:coil containing protein [Vibrio phage 1.117.O._10N.261.45.E9]AUR95427.1 coil containing protein [Vibrio phage 1.207.B._10N.222.51.C2]AUS02318.1 coil containing protein [Vibrio phage 2.117.O._10N.261.45.E9]
MGITGIRSLIKFLPVLLSIGALLVAYFLYTKNAEMNEQIGALKQDLESLVVTNKQQQATIDQLVSQQNSDRILMDGLYADYKGLAKSTDKAYQELKGLKREDEGFAEILDAPHPADLGRLLNATTRDRDRDESSGTAATN